MLCIWLIFTMYMYVYNRTSSPTTPLYFHPFIFTTQSAKMAAAGSQLLGDLAMIQPTLVLPLVTQRFRVCSGALCSCPSQHTRLHALLLFVVPVYIHPTRPPMLPLCFLLTHHQCSFLISSSHTINAPFSFPPHTPSMLLSHFLLTHHQCSFLISSSHTINAPFSFPPHTPSMLLSHFLLI